LIIKILLPLFVAGLLFSCGKKEKASVKEEPYTPPQLPEMEEYLAKQEIVCEPGTYCPDYVAKIVVFDKGSPRFCTGTLVSRNKVLTSASCLPAYLRATDVDCSNYVHIFFSRGNRPPDRSKCQAVLQVSDLDGNLPQYWRDDVAVIELSKTIWREYKDVSRKGFKDGDKVRFFGVEQSNDYTGIIRKEECETVLSSYLFPLSSNESSPNILLSGCARKTGYRGAAILDNFPRVRGVLSDNSPLRSPLENSPLLIKPLKDFVHVSNFACAPFLDETSVLNEQECAKPIDYQHVATERARLLSDDERFGSLVSDLEKTANSISKYYKISVSLNASGDKDTVSYKPICFKNIASWISSVKANGEVHETPEFPAKTLRKGIDSNGRAVTQEVEGKKEKYYLTFSGKRLYKEKHSDVFVSTDSTDTQRLSSIKACQ
jgi:hypothetical protein